MEICLPLVLVCALLFETLAWINTLALIGVWIYIAMMSATAVSLMFHIRNTNKKARHLGLQPAFEGIGRLGNRNILLFLILIALSFFNGFSVATIGLSITLGFMMLVVRKPNMRTLKTLYQIS